MKYFFNSGSFVRKILGLPMLAGIVLAFAACSDATSPSVSLEPGSAALARGPAAASNGVASECKDGGWQALGFSNQGQCVRYVQTGKDSRPASCLEIRSGDAAATDGDYVITPDGQPFSVYCHDMAGTPSEYLTLQKTGPGFNYGGFTAGGARPGTSVVTNYTKIRLDPATLVVNIGDQTFASSTGGLQYEGWWVSSMPLGVAMACISPSNAAGNANIDLTGTPFAVDDTFVVGGFLAAGGASFSSGDQVVNITGGGYCGWNTPAPYIYLPLNGNGGFRLDLKYIGV